MFRFTKLLFLSLFLTGFLCPSAFAVQELALAAEVQLPGSGPWDLQHWLDDSTYGWAQVEGTSAVFCFRTSDSPEYLAIPDSDSWGDGPYYRSFIKLLCDTTVEHLPLICVTSNYYDLGINSGHYFRVLVNPETGNQYSPESSYYWYRGSQHPSFWFSIQTTEIYPPPPFPSQLLLHSYNVNYEYEGIGDLLRDYGESFVTNCWTGTEFQFGAGVFQSFLSDSALRIACSNYIYETLYRSWGGASRMSRIETYTVNESDFGSWMDTVCIDTALSCQMILHIAAQTDSSGTQRMVRDDGHCSDATTGDSLWSNPAISGWISAALLPTSPDERIIRFTDSDKFEIFDASNGNLLDSTTIVLGEPQYLIRLPDHVAEIVTYDAPTHTVRVYKPIQRVSDLTISYDANIERILLAWSSVPNTRSYNVYSSNGFGAPESLLGTVYNGTTQFGIAIDPAVRTKTFYVTANF